MGLNWKFQRGGGIQTKKPSVGRVWIFSGATQFKTVVCLSNSLGFAKLFCFTGDKVLLVRTFNEQVWCKCSVLLSPFLSFYITTYYNFS